MTGRTELPFTGGAQGSGGAMGGDVPFERPMEHPSVEVEWAAGWKLLELRGKSSSAVWYPEFLAVNVYMNPQPQSHSCSPRTAK